MSKKHVVIGIVDTAFFAASILLGDLGWKLALVLAGWVGSMLAIEFVCKKWSIK